MEENSFYNTENSREEKANSTNEENIIKI